MGSKFTGRMVLRSVASTGHGAMERYVFILVPGNIRMTKLRKMRWAGHVA